MALTRTSDDSRIEPAQPGTPIGVPGSKAGVRGIGLLVPVAATLLWELAARIGLISTRLLPAPSEVATTIFDLAASGALAGHVTATLWRVVWGFLAGAAVATVLGVATGMSTRLRRMLDPTLQALRSIPSIAWTPLFILWFGIFEASKITLIAVGVFFPIYLALSDAIAGVDRKLVEVGRIYGFDTPTMVRRILLPASMPTYFIGLRGGLGLGWMFVVAAEFLGASEGLGFLLVDGQMTGRSEVIVAAIVVFAVLGKTTDWMLATTGARLVAWQDGFRTGTTR
ncbi:MAG: ABC transporter permease [Acidimicrobiia bacterium]